MEFIEVVGFDKHQHYHSAKRDMIWFKMRVDCLQDYGLSSLKDGEKWVYVGFICLACKCDNKIPLDIDWIKKQISDGKTDIASTIDKLIASKMLAKCYQDASPNRIEENRIDKSRIEKTIPAVTAPAGTGTVKEKRKYLDFVFLTDEEHQKLKDRFKEQLDAMIESLNAYIGSKGKKYRSHYHTLVSWSHLDKKRGKDARNQSASTQIDRVPGKYDKIESNA